MEQLNQILKQCKAAYHSGWTPEAIEECQSLLDELTHEELFTLRMSRWFRTSPQKHPLYERLVELLHKEHYDKVFEELEEMQTQDLLIRYKELKVSNCKKKALEILQSRYDEMTEEEQKKARPMLVRNGLLPKDEK